MSTNLADTHSFGKFQYVEPTNLYLDLPDNAITFPYEDYSIGVKLSVSIPDRFSCGKEGMSIEFSSDNGTISFFGGSGGGKDEDGNHQGYLSTSFTDVSAQNVDRGNKECLGIESINIAYQQWFYPIINIKFVDVRGASLFMPQEKALQQTIKSGNNDITQIDSGSFFKALFACPSPVFKLTVMGFYGKSVTYDLKMESFQTEFDSDNGNFVANVEFVGNMYGVYTEIPMQYVAIAPYLNPEYWQNNVENGTFTYYENTAMLTFPEFWKRIKTMEKGGEKALQDLRKENNYSLLTQKIQKLKQMNGYFQGFFGNWVSYNLDNKTYYYHVVNGDAANGGNNSGIDKTSSTYKDFQDLVDSFVDTFGDNYSILKSTFPNEYGKFIISGGTFYKYRDESTIQTEGWPDNDNTPEPKDWDDVSLINNNRNKVETPLRNDYELATLTDAEQLVFGDLAKDNKNTMYIFEVSGDFIANVNDFLELADKELAEKEEGLKDLLSQKLVELLGFKLSIGNIFRMLFAHLETFTNRYYKALGNIDNQIKQGTRKISDFGITDANSDIARGIPNVPPFPLVVKKNDANGNNEAIWPGELNASLNTEEMILVNEMLAGGYNYLSALTEAENEIRALNDDSGIGGTKLAEDTSMMIPMTLYDFILNDMNYNPYKSLITKDDYKKTAERIKTVFALRVLYALYAYQINDLQNNGNVIQYVAWAESLNVRKAIGADIDNYLANLLDFKQSDLEPVANNLIDYLQGKIQEAYWKMIGNDIISSEGKYELIKRDSDILMPLKYNIEDIKSDIDSGRIDESKEYIHMEIPSANTDTLKIYYENENFVKNIKDTINKQAENYQLPVKEGEINNFFNRYINGWADRTIFHSNDNFTVCSPERKGNDMKFTGAENSNNIEKDYDGKVYLAIPDNEINIWGNERVKNIQQASNIYYKYVTFGLVNGSAMTEEMGNHGVFQSNFYKAQNGNRYAEAYCFIFSNINDFSILSGMNYAGYSANGKVNLMTLLALGAFWWRMTEEEEPLKFEYNNKTWNPKMKESRNTLPWSDSGSSKGLIETVDEKVTFYSATVTDYSGKDVCIKAFKKFADSSEFQELKEYLERDHKDYDKSDNKVVEMQRLFLKIMYRPVTIIDYAYMYDYDTKEKTNKNSINVLKNIYKQFLENLNKIYDKDNNYSDASDDINSNQLEVKTGLVNDKHLKLSTYLTLKDLYDKYFSNISQSRFAFDSSDSEFKKFLFLDTYYNDISRDLMVNSSFISDLIKSISYNTSDAFNSPDRHTREMSIYEFMSEICENVGMTLLALPQTLASKSREEMEDMFTPFQYKDLETKKSDGCYVAFYSYKPSQHLDIEGNGSYAYQNDSFDIGEGSMPSSLASVSVNSEGNFNTIPSFAVSYAKRNQGLFKKVTLSTTNSQVTEQSIFATMDIASKGNEGPRESTLYGQDLYRVYSNYSYSCTVEMMGNVQIMPLMYFQLNNIPMWHGAYMIISVEHNIVPGDITTRFTGVRVNRNAVPLVDSNIILNENWDYYDSSSSYDRSIPGRGEMGKDYVSSEIYDATTKSYKPAQYKSDKEEEDEKLNATWAVRSRFTASEQIAGWCAFWSYALAKSFINKVRDKQPISKLADAAGGDAKDKKAHDKLVNLGYSVILEKHNLTGAQVMDYVNNKLKSCYKYGDVMYYWSEKEDDGGSRVAHHAQFYAGDAYMPDAKDYSDAVLGEDKSRKKFIQYGKENDGWTTSTLNNYCAPFVYSGPAGGNSNKYGSHTGNTWSLLLCRATRMLNDNNNIAYTIDSDTGKISNRKNWMIKFIKQQEGSGFVKNDNGAGCGRAGFLLKTLNGIDREDFKSMTCDTLKNPGLTEEQWTYAFDKGFYNKAKIDSIKNDSIALLVIDTLFNMGIGRRDTISNLFGTSSWDATIDAINNSNSEEAFSKIWEWRRKYYQDSGSKYTDAWLRRLQDIKFRNTESA